MFASKSFPWVPALAVLCAACPEGPIAPAEPPDAGTTPDAGHVVPTLAPSIAGPAEVARGGRYLVALSEEAGLPVAWTLRADGDCTVEPTPGEEYRGRSFAQVLVGTPGTCTVTASASLSGASVDASHTVSVVDGTPLVQEAIPDDFLGCPLDSDAVVRLEGRTWCSLGRSGLSIYTDTPAETAADFYPIALVDPTHVFVCPLFRAAGAACSVRDADGRLVASVPFDSARGEYWATDGKSPAALVRTLKTQQNVQVDTFTWNGTTLEQQGTRTVDAGVAGRPWLSYVVASIDPQHGGAASRPVVVYDAVTGAKVYEIPEVPYADTVEVLSMRHLVVGRTVYGSLLQLIDGTGTSVGGLVSAPLDGMPSMVTARRELEGTDLIRFDFFDMSGDVPVRVGFGHEWFVEPYRNFLVAGDGVLTSHRLSWISWLRPATP